jgi:hypothetical protein
VVPYERTVDFRDLRLKTGFSPKLRTAAIWYGFQNQPFKVFPAAVLLTVRIPVGCGSASKANCHIEVRILPPQPGSPGIRPRSPISRRRPAFAGFRVFRKVSRRAKSTVGTAEFPKISGRQFQNSHFGDIALGESVRSPLRPERVTVGKILNSTLTTDLLPHSLRTNTGSKNLTSLNWTSRGLGYPHVKRSSDYMGITKTSSICGVLR